MSQDLEELKTLFVLRSVRARGGLGACRPKLGAPRVYGDPLTGGVADLAYSASVSPDTKNGSGSDTTGALSSFLYPVYSVYPVHFTHCVFGITLKPTSTNMR